MGLLASLNVARRGPLVPEPLRVAARHKPTLLGKLAMERWIAMGRSVDDRVKTVAQLRTAALIGCLW